MSVVGTGQIRFFFALIFSVSLSIAQYGNSEYPNIGESIESLEEWESGNIIGPFTDGEILVLDFFAHWCVPCLGVSRELSQFELDTTVDKIRVLPINVESRDPAKTNTFIKRAGLERAYSDIDGRLSTLFGIKALPFVAVVKVDDGNGERSFSVVEEYERFPGVGILDIRLREVRMAEKEDEVSNPQIVEIASTEVFEITTVATSISGLKKPTPATVQLESVEPEVRPEKAIENSTPVYPKSVDTAIDEIASARVLQNEEQWKFSARFTYESMGSSDVDISNTAIETNANLRNLTGTLSLSRSSNGLQYSPSSSDLVGVESVRNEDSYQLGFDGEFGLGDRSSMLATIGAYEGFTDYRSIWLDEFYRQQFEPVVGYRVADPQGYSISVGGRYIYIPATAVLDLTMGYQRDRIAPAYEAIPFEPLTRGRSEIETKVIRIASENLVSRRVRIMQQIQFADTTDRSLRISYLLESRIAIGETLVGKASLATTKESANFESRHIGLSLEKEIGMGFNVSLYGRQYSDDGEIVDPLILSTASPSLGTSQLGTGFLWKGEQSSFSLSFGCYKTDYEALPAISFQFENLYADRDWDFLRLSGSINF